MDSFYKIIKEVNEKFAKLNDRPEKVLMNKDWLNSQIDEGLIKKEEQSTSEKRIFGIPVEFDETVETYKLVYRDPLQEYKDHLAEVMRKALFKDPIDIEFERMVLRSEITVSDRMKDHLYGLTVMKPNNKGSWLP